MNSTLQNRLRELAERNGTRLVFNQDERGTWRAFIKSVRLQLSGLLPAKTGAESLHAWLASIGVTFHTTTASVTNKSEL